ncbi:MAG: hypothetical protein A2X61_00940 [Ignavibacteria bacterium GWB2_35_12]|nr:MAG: hypothetical protein A2X61_00940 [Ignavibacteria bacterium GWB2_35_12]OGU87894.1 MAG: hypothetical protein A2220_10265 [Ignavibacteria bacterium RIFOXYA2_FULL_35_10]OGV21755.1 MAG: hypothetical protein A2475_04165 [Ignavibacteria bacterium RIFOXYC2_FULL_35_21]
MNLKEISEEVMNTIGLTGLPVGVKFYKENYQSEQSNKIDCRFCQAVMEARHGKSITINKDNIACPAAAAALGLKPLTEQLKNGSILQGYGIFRELEVGQKVMETMPRIEQNKFNSVLVKPLKNFDKTPDVIIVEDEVEKLMWLALAYLNEDGGRLEFSTSILQAVCVDACVIPYLSGMINMSFGCYGCRDATDVKTGEAVLGFPYSKLDMVINNLDYLKTQAIERSRAKNVYKAFCDRLGEN